MIHQHQFINSKRSDRRYKSCSKTNLGLDSYRKFLLTIYTLKLSEIDVSRSFRVHFRVFSRYLGKIQNNVPGKKGKQIFQVFRKIHFYTQKIKLSFQVHPSFLYPENKKNCFRYFVKSIFVPEKIGFPRYTLSPGTAQKMKYSEIPGSVPGTTLTRCLRFTNVKSKFLE